MKIEIGKVYVCRDGSKFVAEAETGRNDTYAVQGEDEDGRVTWRSAKGRFCRHPHPRDVVAVLDDGIRADARA